MVRIGGSGYVSRVFHEIRNGNAWGHSESLSGPGSTLENAATLHRSLPLIVAKYGIDRSISSCRRSVFRSLSRSSSRTTTSIGLSVYGGSTT